MSISGSGVSREAEHLEGLGSWRPYWLPPDGSGNGLSASFWAQIAEIPRHSVPGLLVALREQGIPAWAAAVTRVGHHADAEADDATYRLWVATGALNQAEEQLMRVLNDAAQQDDAHPAIAPHRAHPHPVRKHPHELGR